MAANHSPAATSALTSTLSDGITLTFEPRGSARDLFASHDPEIILSGPAGTGKSRGNLEKLHLCCSKYAGMRGLIVRKTRASLTQTAMVTFEREVLHPLDGVYFHGTDQEYRYPNGSVIVVGGLDKPIKVMSAQYDAAYVQEATEVTENDWESLTTRMRNGVMPYQQIVADCNPDAPTHWLRRRADAPREGEARALYGPGPKLRMLESRHEDNPRLWQDGAWTPYGRAYIAILDGLTGVRKARLRHGQWAAAEGLVYEFDRAVHLLDRFEIPATWRRIRVVDFGFTNPFVCAWYAVDGDGRAYLYRELYQTQTLVSDMADRITALSAGERIEATIADHDAEDRATLHTKGIHTIAAQKSVSLGIQAVQDRLRPAGDGTPRLFILRDSLVARDEDLAARHKPLCTEQEFDSYCLIAGTQVETARGPVAIESIRSGDLVWTRAGLRQVRAAGMTQPNAAVWTVRLASGVTLTGTGEHLVWTRNGHWIGLKSLSCSDTVETWNPSCSTALSTVDILTPSRGPADGTSDRSEKGADISTPTCGAPCSDPSLWDTRSTTETATLSITPSTIWLASRLASTWRHIEAILSAAVQSGWQNWTRRVCWRLNGGRVRMDGQVLRRPLGGCGNVENRPPETVSSAGRSSKVDTWGTPGSARGAAMLRGGVLDAHITRSAYAPFVDCDSRPISGGARPVAPNRVLSVIAEPHSAPVYNLSVEGYPEYYANGVLVHNCWPKSADGKPVKEEPVKIDDHGLDATRYLCSYLDGIHAGPTASRIAVSGPREVLTTYQPR